MRPKLAEDHIFEAVAAIEAVFELGKVAGHVLGSDGMVGASDAVLDVADCRVDPFEGGNLDGPRPAARDHGVVVATGPGDGGEAAQTITDHGGPGRQQATAQLLDLGLAKPLDRPELEAADGYVHSELPRC